MLPVPENYYDDLAARLGLEPDVVARLRAANILYDEDAQGAYYQIYSRAFGDGIFFEIVQRGARYGGYGAPNAPFRIAAQRRLMPATGIPRR